MDNVIEQRAVFVGLKFVAVVVITKNNTVFVHYFANLVKINRRFFRFFKTKRTPLFVRNPVTYQVFCAQFLGFLHGLGGVFEEFLVVAARTHYFDAALVAQGFKFGGCHAARVAAFQLGNTQRFDGIEGGSYVLRETIAVGVGLQPKRKLVEWFFVLRQHIGKLNQK